MTPETLNIRPENAQGTADAVSVGTAAYKGSPPFFIPRDELFFWTPAWQLGETESAQEREDGKSRRFASGDGLIEWLQADDD